MISNLKNFRKIEAKSVKNQASDKKEMYLLRGGPLDKISKEEERLLKEKYNLKTVIDFRSQSERLEKPNKKIRNVDYYQVEVLDPDKSVCKNPKEFLSEYQKSDDLNFMQKLYKEFSLNTFTQESYRDFLNIVAKSRGSVYFHCTAGKDRTGFASMLLLEILEADEKDIYLDYLKTNDFSKDDYILILNDLKKAYDYQIEDSKLKDMIGVRKEYLQYSKDLILKDYKSVLEYIEKALRVDSDTINLIKSKYTV